MKKELLSVLSLSFLFTSSMMLSQQKNDTVKEKSIEEVVLINVGYGKQKKSVVTGAISKVTSQDLENVPTGRIEQSIQGRTAGVSIAANSGAPGSASTVRVRGLTSFGNNNPLWVVDGVPIDQSGIGFINQSDIESIEVLKDAASAAIYGTRAAGGVIMVTTKSGKKGRWSLNYNGFLGFSSPERLVKVLNATEYAAIMNERSIGGGGNIIYNDLGSLGVGTDWQKQVFNNHAARSSHEFSASGGNENSSFYMSFGYQDQEGIVATETSRFNKKTFRFNSQHKIFDKIKIAQNFAYSYSKQNGIGNQNTEFGGVLPSAIMLDPLTPVVVTDPILANQSPYNQTYAIRDENGNPYGISSAVGQEIVNPVAYIKRTLGNFGWGNDFVGNVSAEAEILDGLTVKSNIGGKMSFWGSQGFNPKFYLNSNEQNDIRNSLWRNTGQALDWILTNTVNYAKKFGDHDVSVLLGQEVNIMGIGFEQGATHYNLPTNNWAEATFNMGVTDEDKRGWASEYIEHRLTSLFARLNYNYKERYILTGIIRRDGSSKFGPNKKYGYFPSFSAGWNVSNESFWPTNNIVNTLKIRGGYGSNGNVSSLDNFQYLALMASGFNYTFMSNTIGYTLSTLDNPDLHWEVAKQTNVGFEARLFKNLNVNFDIYSKKSSDLLMQVAIPGYVGVTNLPWANVADMKNEGIEVELNYRKNWEDFSLSLSGTFATLKNTVTNINGVEYLSINTAGFQSMGSITRTEVGHAYNAFYGFQHLGIFQNWDEVHSYVGSSGTMIQPDAQPGDFRWQDSNGDGKIDDEDKVFLGNPLPKYTFGFTVNLNYKNFDLMAFAQGAAGNKIFQGLRRLDVANANYQRNVLDRWTGEGTSNDYPRLSTSDPNMNFTRMSQFYLEDGDYLRLKILQLGYTLPDNAAKSINASKIRLYLTGENIYTLTKYTGYDPEIGGNVFGIDKGYYPQARTFMFGVNVQF